jgi:hypothetical protein
VAKADPAGHSTPTAPSTFSAATTRHTATRGRIGRENRLSSLLTICALKKDLLGLEEGLLGLTLRPRLKLYTRAGRRALTRRMDGITEHKVSRIREEARDIEAMEFDVSVRFIKLARIAPSQKTGSE